MKRVLLMILNMLFYQFFWVKGFTYQTINHTGSVNDSMLSQVDNADCVCAKHYSVISRVHNFISIKL